jgi:hypothetical protein
VKHKLHPVPDRLSLTSGSLGNLNRDVYGATSSPSPSPSPRVEPLRGNSSSSLSQTPSSPSLNSPAAAVYSTGFTPAASPNTTNTSNRTNKSGTSSPAAVYGSFNAPAAAPGLGVTTAPGAVEHATPSTPISAPDSLGNARSASAALLPTGTGLFRTESLKTTPAASVERYNAFFKPTTPRTAENAPVSDPQLAHVTESDAYVTAGNNAEGRFFVTIALAPSNSSDIFSIC